MLSAHGLADQFFFAHSLSWRHFAKSTQSALAEHESLNSCWQLSCFVSRQVLQAWSGSFGVAAHAVAEHSVSQFAGLQRQSKIAFWYAAAPFGYSLAQQFAHAWRVDSSAQVPPVDVPESSSSVEPLLDEEELLPASLPPSVPELPLELELEVVVVVVVQAMARSVDATNATVMLAVFMDMERNLLRRRASWLDVGANASDS